MKYQKHYLSDDSSNKLCPLQQGVIQCDSYCAWFDHEEQDCRKLLTQSKIEYNLIRIGNLMEKENGRRTYKF